MFATKTGLCITKNTHMEARWCLWDDLSSARIGTLVKVGGNCHKTFRYLLEHCRGIIHLSKAKPQTYIQTNKRINFSED